MSLQKFTDTAREVLTLAQEEAKGLKHNYVGTEHILLGLLRLDEGNIVEIFTLLQLSVEKVREQVHFIVGPGERGFATEDIGLTPRANKIIVLAVDEARRLNSAQVDPEHIFLGLIREGEGIAGSVLESLGVTLNKAREITLRILNKDQTDKEIYQKQLELIKSRLARLMSEVQDLIQAVEQLERMRNI